MPAGRRSIEHPMVIDLSGQAVPALRFVLQTAYLPVGIVERPSPGVVNRLTPWYTEVALELAGTETVVVLNLVPMDDRTVLLAACLDATFEPFFRLVSGADFGDRVTALTERHWPEIHAMLLRGNDPKVTNGRVLAMVATPPGRVQWIVADLLPSSEVETISTEFVQDLIRCSLETVVRTTNVATDLPGIIEVMGGPTRADRRLKALTGLLASGADFGGVLDGGIDADELVKLVGAAKDAFTNVRALRD